jgi:hypothetical protein
MWRQEQRQGQRSILQHAAAADAGSDVAANTPGQPFSCGFALCHCLQAPELTDEQKEYLAKAAADEKAACKCFGHAQCAVIHLRVSLLCAGA